MKIYKDLSAKFLYQRKDFIDIYSLRVRGEMDAKI